MSTRHRNRKAAVLAAAVLIAATAVLCGGAARAQEAAEQAEPPPTYARTPVELVPYSRAIEPYRRFFVTPLIYRGPSRAKPEPADLDSIRIGLLAPLEGTRDDALGASMLRGVELALHEANRAGGYAGLPFELIARNDQAIWGSSSNTLVQFAYHDRVWAIIGSIDSNSTHVALRAALKAEVPMVNVGSTDPTVTETGIPWIIRTTPDDRQTGYRLAHHVFSVREAKRVAVLRASDRYGRFGIKEFRDAARRLGNPLALEILFEPGKEAYDAELERVTAADVDAIVLWSSADDGGRIVEQIRAAGLGQPIFGTDRLVSEEFLSVAGAAAEGVEATAWMEPGRTDAVWQGFRERYRERYRSDPDTWAAYAYDATVMTIDAIRAAGLNHARIMDELGGLGTYQGVAGPMIFDTTWNNVASPVVVRIQDGGFRTLDEAGELAAVPELPGDPVRVGLIAGESETERLLARGALAAAAEVNADGGIDGRPLQLVELEPGSPWRDGASRIARMSAVDGFTALIGAGDGATAHVAAQIATRRGVPFITAAGEATLTQAGDRWVVRAVPSDIEQARALLRTLPSPERARVVLVTPAGREGRERREALRAACSDLGVEILAEVDGTSPATMPSSDAVMLWLDAPDALAMLGQLDARRSPRVLGSLRLADGAFLRAAEAHGGSVAVAALPTSGQPAGATAGAALAEGLGHDLVALLAHAARGADGDPERILQRLLEPSDLTGRTGALRFDARGNRVGEVRILLPGRGGQATPGETP